MRAMVTGGCGFIGSALVRRLVRDGLQVLNIDKLTYAGDLRAVATVAESANYSFLKCDVADRAAMIRAVKDFEPDVIFHLAAESHVDRSIDAPAAFIETNVLGVFSVLEAARGYWSALSPASAQEFRFIHVSTDEVFGSLDQAGVFTESSAYAPNSPYSASKAGGDHLARAWGRTYGLPVCISNCSNNYGPFQHREKLIPTVIRKALAGQPIPVYGAGANMRDWLPVEDHVDALALVARAGRPGQSYLFGSGTSISNVELVRMICALLDGARPRSDGRPYADLISFVPDRPGHDWRYAVDPHKAHIELGWTPAYRLREGLAQTVAWYLEHRDWIMAGAHLDDRQGLGP